jgi:hypothetical protein
MDNRSMEQNCQGISSEGTYVYFTKTQIQDKERELKRDYRLLKDAKNQSGAHFDEKTGRITADPALWKKYTDFSS